MRLASYSDIHLEYADFFLPETDADIIVLAGDIGEGLQGIAWAKKYATPDRPIIYTIGNHELYDNVYPDLLVQIRAEAAGTSVYFLENQSCIIKNTKVIGCTLWTDFCLFGESLEGHSRLIAGRNMNDYQYIRVYDIEEDKERPLTPLDTQRLNTISVRYLKTELAKPHDGPVVVVTHHAPSSLMLNPHFQDDPLNPAYASNLEYLIKPPVSLWASGHTHFSTKQIINGVPCVANCRGYPKSISDRIDENFDPELVIEI